MTKAQHVLLQYTACNQPSVMSQRALKHLLGEWRCQVLLPLGPAAVLFTFPSLLAAGCQQRAELLVLGGLYVCELCWGIFNCEVVAVKPRFKNTDGRRKKTSTQTLVPHLPAAFTTPSAAEKLVVMLFPDLKSK